MNAEQREQQIAAIFAAAEQRNPAVARVRDQHVSRPCAQQDVDRAWVGELPVLTPAQNRAIDRHDFLTSLGPWA